MPKVGPGIKNRSTGRRQPARGLAGTMGRRGFFSAGSHDPTPSTDNIITDAGLSIITGDGDAIVRT